MGSVMEQLGVGGAQGTTTQPGGTQTGSPTQTGETGSPTVPPAGAEPEPEPVVPPVPVEPPEQLVTPPEESNTPLSIPGTFARPGTEGAMPFRTPQFNVNRVQGGGTRKKKAFGPGVSIAGGASPFAADEDEVIRQITGYLR